MADKEVGHLPVLSEPRQQLHNLLLHGNIQGRGGLVTDQQLGLNRQRPGNGCPLALASANLIGVAAGKFIWQAALFQKKHYPFGGLRLGKPRVAQAFPNAAAQGFSGVEGAHRVLEDHLHFSVGSGKRFSLGFCDILTVQADCTLGRVNQSAQKLCQGAFSAAGFSNDSQCLPWEQLKAYLVYGGKISLMLPMKGFGQAADL